MMGVLLLPVAGCYNEDSFLLLLREFPPHACQYVGDFFAYALGDFYVLGNFSFRKFKISRWRAFTQNSAG